MIHTKALNVQNSHESESGLTNELELLFNLSKKIQLHILDLVKIENYDKRKYY